MINITCFKICLRDRVVPDVPISLQMTLAAGAHLADGPFLL
jgi:hypothetical protein